MKCKLIVLLAASASACCVLAQETGNVVFQSAGSSAGGAMTGAVVARASSTPVQGSPYSATVTNESVQTLADGNRIVQTNTGTVARDSQGRTRHDMVLPAIGNLSPAEAPHLVVIEDPVAHVVYTLNLTDKTARKMPLPSGGAGGLAVSAGGGAMTVMRAGKVNALSTSVAGAAPLPEPPPDAGMVFQQTFVTNPDAQASTEDLGSQTMEGVVVNGTRTTHTIPAGQIGNEKPISSVTEVWTSPDLKTIVYSKRNDPRMGEQTFQLTNIVRAEPDASLFTVPADFKLTDGPESIMYRVQQ
jgi:hypothetical protein